MRFAWIAALLLVVGCGDNSSPTQHEHEEVAFEDPLSGRTFTQLTRTLQKKWWQFEDGEYWVRTSVQADSFTVAGVVYGVYNIIPLGNEHYHMHGTVLEGSTLIAPQREVVYRYAWDLELYIGFESLVVDNSDHWREVLPTTED